MCAKAPCCPAWPARAHTVSLSQAWPVVSAHAHEYFHITATVTRVNSEKARSLLLLGMAFVYCGHDAQVHGMEALSSVTRRKHHCPVQRPAQNAPCKEHVCLHA